MRDKGQTVPRGLSSVLRSSSRRRRTRPNARAGFGVKREPSQVRRRSVICADAQFRAGVTLGAWNVSTFVDNVFDTHTVTNYMLGQADSFNPAGSPHEQQNQYTFRPRTFGLTATMHL